MSKEQTELISYLKLLQDNGSLLIPGDPVVEDILARTNAVNRFLIRRKLKSHVADINAALIKERMKSQEEKIEALIKKFNQDSEPKEPEIEPEQSLIERKESEPPWRAVAIMDFLLPHSNRESLIGDLEEEYRTRILNSYSLRTARRWYWWQALRSVLAVIWERIRMWLGAAFLVKAAGWLAQKFGF